jgi:hypothetical protein
MFVEPQTRMPVCHNFDETLKPIEIAAWNCK